MITPVFRISHGLYYTSCFWKWGSTLLLTEHESIGLALCDAPLVNGRDIFCHGRKTIKPAVDAVTYFRLVIFATVAIRCPGSLGRTIKFEYRIHDPRAKWDINGLDRWVLRSRGFLFIIEGQVPYVSFMEMRFFSGHGLKLTTSTMSHLVRCFLQENLEIPLAPVIVFSFLSSGAVSTCLTYVMNMKPSSPSAADRSWNFGRAWIAL